MASGTLEFGTSNANITGRVVWSSSSNGPETNSSNVYVTLQYYRRDGYNTYGTLNGAIYIDGAGYGVSQYVSLTGSNGWVTIGSASRTVGHNTDGTRVINISANGAISGTSLSSSSGSWNIGLDTIPRYTAITRWNVDAIGQTYVKCSWQTADTCDFARVYLNNEGQHTDIPGSINTSSGTFTYTGMTTGSAAVPSISTLIPGTSYNLKLQVRRKDSQLWTTSSNYMFTTAPIATFTAATAVNFNIGQNLTLNFTNYANNKSYLALDIQRADGTWEQNVATVGETLQTASYTWNLSVLASTLYAKVTTRNSANIKVRCGTTINGRVYENSLQGTMSVVNSNPIFTSYSYGNADNKTQGVLSNTSYLPENYGDMQAHISAANKAVAVNQAVIVKYVATVADAGNVIRLTKEAAYSSSQIDFRFGSFNTAGTYQIKIYALDSRGNSSSVITQTFYVLPYHRPQTAITMSRVNEYEQEFTINMTSVYSKLMLGGTIKNSSFTVKYRYCIAGETMGNTYYNLSGFTNTDETPADKKVSFTKSAAAAFTPLTLDPTKTFNFEFTVADKISEVIETAAVTQGIPIFMEADNGKISVGMVPDWNSSANLQVATDILATDSKGNKRLVLQDMDAKNADLLNAIYPVGICIEFSKNVDPNSLYPKMKWIRHAQGRVTVGIDESDASFSIVGKTGGEKTSTLQYSQMPRHSHNITANGSFTISNGQGSGGSGIPSGSSSWGNPGYGNAHWWTMYCSEAGDTQAHNNLPPYITVYKWTRTA